MTREEAIEMIKAKIDCMERDSSGIYEECNIEQCDDCFLNYWQGNIGEQKEYLKMAIKSLEDEANLIDKIKKAREEIEDSLFVAYGEYDNPHSYYEVVEVKDVLEILNKLIEGVTNE